VSIRTLYRDIATLQGQGANIEGEPGLGYVLKPGFMLPPLMFSEDEIEAITLGVAWVKRRADERLGKAAANAAAKIGAVLPEDLRREMETSSLMIGPGEPLWRRYRPVGGARRDPARAQAEDRILRQGRRAKRAHGVAIPARLLRPYAHDRRLVRTAAGYRHFRADRIVSMEVSEERAGRRRLAMAKEWRESEMLREPFEPPRGLAMLLPETDSGRRYTGLVSSKEQDNESDRQPDRSLCRQRRRKRRFLFKPVRCKSRSTSRPHSRCLCWTAACKLGLFMRQAVQPKTTMTGGGCELVVMAGSDAAVDEIIDGWRKRGIVIGADAEQRLSAIPALRSIPTSTAYVSSTIPMREIAMSKNWIAVASADHVRRGVAGGFMQVNHGKAAPLETHQAGRPHHLLFADRSVSRRTGYQAFTAIGTVKDGEPIRARWVEGFTPFRRDVAWLKRATRRSGRCCRCSK
jgi:hypothetical protein